MGACNQGVHEQHDSVQQYEYISAVMCFRPTVSLSLLITFIAFQELADHCYTPHPLALAPGFIAEELFPPSTGLIYKATSYQCHLQLGMTLHAVKQQPHSYASSIFCSSVCVQYNKTLELRLTDTPQQWTPTI